MPANRTQLTCLLALAVCALSAAGAKVANYDESKVPAYTLPNPLIASDGREITSEQDWRAHRRPEILELFRTHVYGRSPGKPTNANYRVFESDRNALDGLATRKQVTISFTDQPDGPSMDLLMYLPNKATRPVPVFVILNFRGNHSISHDPAVRLSRSWMTSSQEGVVDNRATEKTRGCKSSRYPLQLLLSRGYGFATIYYGDIDPDFDDGFKNGVHAVMDRYPEGERPADAWGSIGAWAWGMSRALDYLETESTVDARSAIAVGHSRLGKTALWAGAQDERFAVVISNNSGCGGAALSKRAFGETVERINTSFPHWFCRNFRQYNSNEQKLPLDQHMLIALIAPRPVYVASAEKDKWADPHGEFLAAKGAEPVYRLFGKEGLPTATMPALEQPVAGSIGYHIRRGPHDLTEYDWQRYLDFADKHLRAQR